MADLGLPALLMLMPSKHDRVCTLFWNTLLHDGRGSSIMKPLEVVFSRGERGCLRQGAVLERRGGRFAGNFFSALKSGRPDF